MAILKFTNVFYEESSKNTSFIKSLFRAYVLTVIFYMLLTSFAIRIVNVPVDYAIKVFPQEYNQKLNIVQNKRKAEGNELITKQKVLFISAAYGLRIFGEKFFLLFSKPQVGDYVLVKNKKSKIHNNSLFSQMYIIFQNVRHVVSLGIIPNKRQTEHLFLVSAVGPKKVRFSGQSGIEEENNNTIIEAEQKVNKLPFIASSGTMSLTDTQVYLSAPDNFQLDSRFLGAFETKQILGRGLMYLGPVWSFIQ